MHSRGPIASHVAVGHSSIGVRVARSRLGQPQGWGLPVKAQRLLFRRERVDHDACGCPAPRTRCYATAAARADEMDANRAGVCDMGVQARGLLPARAARRGSRGGLRAAKRRTWADKTRDGGFGGKQRLASIDLRARPEKQPRGVKGIHSHSTVNTKYHSSAATPRQRRSPTHRREAAPTKHQR